MVYIHICKKNILSKDLINLLFNENDTTNII